MMEIGGLYTLTNKKFFTRIEIVCYEYESLKNSFLHGTPAEFFSIKEHIKPIFLFLGFEKLPANVVKINREILLYFFYFDNKKITIIERDYNYEKIDYCK